MKVDTYLFGAIEVDPEKIVTFPQGLVGFEDCKRFMLIHQDEIDAAAPFTLQSLDDGNIAFMIVDPVVLGFNYELALSDAENALLQTPAADEVIVMQVIYKKDRDGQSEIRPNLRAPLLINTRARVGLQKVMEVIKPNITLSNLVSKV